MFQYCHYCNQETKHKILPGNSKRTECYNCGHIVYHDEPKMVEVKWYITAKINSEQLSQGAISDSIRYIIECDGFGEIVEIEEK